MTKSNMFKCLLGFALGTFMIVFILFMSLENVTVEAQFTGLPNLAEAGAQNFDLEEAIIDFDDSIEDFSKDSDEFEKGYKTDDVRIGNMIYYVDKRNRIIVCYCSQASLAYCNTNVYLANADS